MEHHCYNAQAAKKPTNVTVNSDLLAQAKEMKINLSQALEERLAEMVHKAKQEQWRKENQEAFEAYNKRVEKFGGFSDHWRKF